MGKKHTISDLHQMQSLPLTAKVRMTKNRIDQWVEEFGEDGVYVSFSGGKDSTVLVDIVRNVCGYKDIPLVFVDVPTQYPELKTFVKTFENAEIVKPKISFVEVCEKYGFPLISKEVSGVVQESRKCLTKIFSEKSKIGRQLEEDDYSKLTVRTAKLLGALTKDNQIQAHVLDDNKSDYTCEKYKFFIDAPFEISDKCCDVMKKHRRTNTVKTLGANRLLQQWQAKACLEHKNG